MSNHHTNDTHHRLTVALADERAVLASLVDRAACLCERLDAQPDNADLAKRLARAEARIDAQRNTIRLIRRDLVTTS